MLTNFRGSAIDNTGMNETLRNVIRVLAVIESAINHSRHEELAREVCLRLRRFLESVATYTKNEFNRILGRLNQFQAMVNSTNLPITTSLAITANSRMNIKFFVRYDDHIPLINVFRTSDRMIDIPLASISPSIPNYVDRPYQNTQLRRPSISESVESHRGSIQWIFRQLFKVSSCKCPVWYAYCLD